MLKLKTFFVIFVACLSLPRPFAKWQILRLKLFRLTVFFSLSGYKCLTLFGWILETELSIGENTCSCITSGTSVN